MKIVVNDANILIDLISIDLLNAFFQLDFEFHTNDLIINEIKEGKHLLLEIIESNQLIVNKTKAEEYSHILALQTKNLSFQDCSIWYYTKQIGGILLTGDRKLRKTVEKDHIEVRGILFIFDLLIESNILSISIAIEKLITLAKINTRLPMPEIERRLEKWKKQMDNL